MPSTPAGGSGSWIGSTWPASTPGRAGEGEGGTEPALLRPLDEYAAVAGGRF